MMASTLQTPAPFTFNSPDKWPKWKRSFEQYRVASGLDKEGNEHQVSTQLYCLGEEAEDVLTRGGRYQKFHITIIMTVNIPIIDIIAISQ